MNKNEFNEKYEVIAARALACAEKARKEGLLSLEEEIDQAKADERDIFEYGLRFVVDGIDYELVEKILSAIIGQEHDGQMKTLKTIQKEAVLMIQAGTNPHLLYAVMNSYTDIPLNNYQVKQLLEE